MYCPECGVEYREGFTECADCRVALMPGGAPEMPEPERDLVAVFESNDRLTVGLAKGLLEGAGIPFLVDEGETFARFYWVYPSCRLLVTQDREAEARELLEPLRA